MDKIIWNQDRTAWTLSSAVQSGYVYKLLGDNSLIYRSSLTFKGGGEFVLGNFGTIEEAQIKLVEVVEIIANGAEGK